MAAKPAVARPADLFAGMNDTEKEWATILEAEKRDGTIEDWRFESFTLTLAPDCRYTPDFWVLRGNGEMEFHETKGFWRDDAKVKIRVAARMFPWFTFTAYRKRPKKEGGGWHKESYDP